MRTVRLLLAIAVLASVSCGHNSANKENEKSRLHVTVNNCLNITNLKNMFDDSELTNFQPDELDVYKLRFDSSKVRSMRLVPTTRRGYSNDFTILACTSGKVYQAECSNPTITFDKYVDSVDIVFVNHQKLLRKEFYRDSVPFVIETEEDADVIGINTIEFFSDTEKLNDTTVLKVGTEKRPSEILSNVKKLYTNKLDGSLLGRKMRYLNPQAKTIFKITESGMISLLDAENHFVNGTISENTDGQYYISVEDNFGFGTDKSNLQFFINDKILEITDLDVKVAFEANDLDYINLKTFSDLFLFDIRYATDNNFTHHQMYDEPICYLRYAVARDLMGAANDFVSKGYKIKMFDGYRPYHFQQVMWDVCPNPNFLSNPLKGSNHNRGVAVDLTICDAKTGMDVEMGTCYDFCGKEAYTNYTNLPDSVLASRNLLWDVLNKHGFSKSKTEWWHLSDRNYISACGLSNFIPKEFVELN